MDYRDRDTGDLVSAYEIKERAKNPAKKLPTITPPRRTKKVQLEWQGVSLGPEETWDQFVYDLVNVDPVNDVDQPAYDSFSQTITQAKPKKKNGQWHQNWVVKELYTAKQLKIKLIEKVIGLCNRKVSSGAIVHTSNGELELPTNPEGMVNLMFAKFSEADPAILPLPNGLFEFDKTEIEDMFLKASEHLRECMTTSQKLIKKINKAEDPLSVDLSILE